ncbi:alpha/beta fold hydrolase [Nocardia tengchongensis]|uniref:alpha/beta fold hydrolase n=1 Tax=Nocardia tengchongensis TaxID=2055889 RepID=UPI00361FD12E
MFSNPRYAIGFMAALVATFTATPIWASGPVSEAAGPSVVQPAGGRLDSPDGPGKPKPTIVLVHGAFADASSWQKVTDSLQRAGYPVIATANPLEGLAQDAARLSSTIAPIEGPIVLVGHSYGGAVISQAAEGNPKVKALVFITALIPDVGEQISALAAKSTTSQLGPTLVPANYTNADGSTGTQLTVNPDKFHDVFAADIPADLTRVIAASQRPTDAAVFSSVPTAAAWHTIPSWSLIARQDLALGADLERFEADRAHSKTVEVDSSHVPMFSQTNAVTDLILDAAKHTGR